MPRVLRRPMFRLGGNTDQGIMSGVAPRQGYAEGDLIRGAQERKKVLSEMIGRPSDRSLQDFMIDWGLGMASTPPTGNVFQTAASVARAPYEKFRESKAQEKGIQRQIGMAAAEAEMSHQDKMTEIAAKYGFGGEDARKFNFDVEQYMRIHGVNRNTAEREVSNKEYYSKAGHLRPEVQRKEEINTIAEKISERDDIMITAAIPIAEAIQNAIEGKFDAEDVKNKDEEISGRLDRNQLYIIESDIGERQADDVYGIIVDMPEGDYVNNKVYYNPKDKQFYVYNGSTRQFHIVILPGQEAIKHAPTFE
jgi:hypothetical protein